MDGGNFPGKIVFEPVERDQGVKFAEVAKKRVVQRELSPRLSEPRRQPPIESRSRVPVATGAAVCVGLVALVAVWYVPGTTQTRPAEVTAYCVDQNDVLADNEFACDAANVSSNGFGAVQYHYYYGGDVGPDRRVFGGSTTVPPDFTEVKTASGKTIQRGGFGSSAGGKSGGS